MTREEMHFRAATAAMQAMLTNPLYNTTSSEEIAAMAIEQADDMLVALASREQDIIAQTQPALSVAVVD